MRKFERISKEQFIKDITPLSFDEELFDSIQIPKRSTKNSAGYDICAVGHHIIPAGGVAKIPTGLKVSMELNEVLLLFIRSSLGTKHGLNLSNNVGVIDSDYYNNSDNEGHFWIIIRNNSDVNFEVNNGDRLCQGIFVEYKVTEDDNAEGIRSGGFGSTGK